MARRKRFEHQAVGCSLFIDDFGTGCSSLSYLKIFRGLRQDRPDHRQGRGHGPRCTSLVTAIINMAYSLNLKTTAKSVETEDQGKILRLLKRDVAQEYDFAPALPPADAERLPVQ